MTDLGKGRQLYHSQCAGDVSVRSSAFPVSLRGAGMQPLGSAGG